MAFKRGTKVRFAPASGNDPERVLTIQSKEQHNGQTFYRLKEIFGGLFLPSSLVKVGVSH